MFLIEYSLHDSNTQHFLLYIVIFCRISDDCSISLKRCSFHPASKSPNTFLESYSPVSIAEHIAPALNILFVSLVDPVDQTL